MTKFECCLGHLQFHQYGIRFWLRLRFGLLALALRRRNRLRAKKWTTYARFGGLVSASMSDFDANNGKHRNFWKDETRDQPLMLELVECWDPVLHFSCMLHGNSSSLGSCLPFEDPTRQLETTRQQSWSRHEVVFVGNVCTCCLPLCYLRGKNGKIPPVASYLGEFGPRLLESILRESARTELLLASLSNHDIIKMFVASFGLKYRRQIWRIEAHKLRLYNLRINETPTPTRFQTCGDIAFVSNRMIE